MGKDTYFFSAINSCITLSVSSLSQFFVIHTLSRSPACKFSGILAAEQDSRLNLSIA